MNQKSEGGQPEGDETKKKSSSGSSPDGVGAGGSRETPKGDAGEGKWPGGGKKGENE